MTAMAGEGSRALSASLPRDLQRLEPPACRELLPAGEAEHLGLAGTLGQFNPVAAPLGTGPANKGSLVRVAAGILVDATALSGLGAGPMTAMSTGGQRCLSDGSYER